MGWRSLIIGASALHNVTKAYGNVFKSIDAFVEPTPPTNIFTNDTSLNQYSIQQVIKVFGLKFEAAVQKSIQ